MHRPKDGELLTTKEQAKSTAGKGNIALRELRNGRSMPAVQRTKGRGTR